MLQVTDVSLRFGDRKLFEDVNIKFTEGNCYGLTCIFSFFSFDILTEELYHIIVTVSTSYKL
jgi:hypothetical protein